MWLLRTYLFRVHKHQFFTARSSFLSKLDEITAETWITCHFYKIPRNAGHSVDWEIFLSFLYARNYHQRWSPRGRPRGHSLKTLASKPQVFENFPVLSSKTAQFLNRKNFVDRLKKNFQHLFLEFAWKNFWWTLFFEDRFFFFFWEFLRLCSWPGAFLFLSSRGSVLERAVLVLASRALCPRLHLWLW